VSVLSDDAQKAMPYWRQIEHAAATRQTTADMWAEIRAQAAEYGLPTAGVGIMGVGELRTMAGNIQEQSRQLMAMKGSKRVTGRMFTVAPWARTEQERRALPMTQVRFLHTYRDGDDVLTSWRSVVFEGSISGTVDQLKAMIDDEAANMAQDYGVEHIGVDAIQLLRQ
jgi:hypothetical protein